ncbi:MAG: hypothetical protein U0892_14025 [Pirellulales bacterium]
MRLKSQNRNAVYAAMLVMGSLTSSTLLMGQTPDEAGTQAVQSQNAPTLHKFSFKHAKAADVLKIFMQLDRVSNPDEVEGFAVDERTNSIVFIADPTEAREFESAFSLLDSESQEPIGAADRGSAVGISTPSSPLAHSRAFSFNADFSRDEPTEKLKQAYNEAEQNAHQLADKLKLSTSPSESERKELQAAVRKSFDARQSLQRAELADLAQRMQSIQQSIDMRDKLAERIVEKRVTDLLNTDLKWDVAPALAAGTVAHDSTVKLDSTTDSTKQLESMKRKVQGRWIIENMQSKDSDETFRGVELIVKDELMTFVSSTIDMQWRGLAKRQLGNGTTYEVDFVYEPHGDQLVAPGIISCDGDTLTICYSLAAFSGDINREWRPDRFMPGSKALLIECRRAPEEQEAKKHRSSTVGPPLN